MPPQQQIRQEIDQSDDPRASKGRGGSKLSVEMATPLFATSQTAKGSVRKGEKE